jgi:hypothetical protein
MKRLAVTLALALVASGCATKNINSSYTIGAKPAEGIVAGSISYHGSFSGYSVDYTNVSTGKSGWIQIGQGAVLIPILPKSDFDEEDTTGQVFAISLPAGNYVASRWNVSSGQAHFGSRTPFSINFKVEPGKMVYLGSFQFTETSHFLGVVTGARLAYKDEANRDLPMLHKRFPVLAGVPISSAVSPGTVQQNVGSSASVDITVPTYAPVK